MYCKTERLELKPMEERDLPALADLVSDSTVKKTYMVPDFENREAALALAKRIQTMSQDPSRYIVGIYLEENLIGMMNDTEVVGDVVEVYIKNILPEKMKVKLVIMSKIKSHITDHNILYFTDSGHIDRWDYSSGNRRKNIFTVFE